MAFSINLRTNDVAYLFLSTMFPDVIPKVVAEDGYRCLTGPRFHSIADCRLEDVRLVPTLESDEDALHYDGNAYRLLVQFSYLMQRQHLSTRIYSAEVGFLHKNRNGSHYATFQPLSNFSEVYDHPNSIFRFETKFLLARAHRIGL